MSCHGLPFLSLCSLAVNMYFLELCELLLFDDNRSAFHVLLKYFEEEGGIEILKE